MARPTTDIPSPPESGSGFMRLIDAWWRAFSSVRLAIALLLLIGAGAVLGTFVPQLPQSPGLSALHLERMYSPVAFQLLSFFGAFDLFHSWWFSLLLLLLSLNLTACSLPRLFSLGRELARCPPEPSGVAGVRRLEIPWDRPVTIDEARRRTGMPLRRAAQNSAFWLAERGRLGRAGFLLVHLGIIVILLGGGLGQVASLEGTLALAPGEESDAVEVQLPEGGSEMLHLPFRVRCLDFSILRYAPGDMAVRHYVSEIEVTGVGQPPQRARLEVNRPFAREGYRLFQSSYQAVRALDRATLRLPHGDGSREVSFAPGEEILRAPDGGRYRLHGIETGTPHGDLARIEVEYPDGRRQRYPLFLRHPLDLSVLLPARPALSLLSVRPGYATVLSVSRDPSPPVLWLGSALLLFGLLLAFGPAHRRLWIRPTPQGTLEVFLWARRGAEEFERDVGERLRTRTTGGPR
ncbi:MAG: cytochrome c biogenesis protein ResB [Myxococcales bacterium]|nr:cytochrome c biogenesis protein ResB [Myxococcales bacterium]